MGRFQKAIANRTSAHTKLNAWQNYSQARHCRVERAERSKNCKNHVSETDLSPGGFPFHFAGPKKQVKK